MFSTLESRLCNVAESYVSSIEPLEYRITIFIMCMLIIAAFSHFFCSSISNRYSVLSTNPIPTGLGHMTLIYGLIPPMAGRNRVKRTGCLTISNVLIYIKLHI
jgi:hypothetical protein